MINPMQETKQRHWCSEDCECQKTRKKIERIMMLYRPVIDLENQTVFTARDYKGIDKQLLELIDTLLQEERGKTIEKIKQSKYKSEKDKFGYDPLDNPIFANEKAVNKKLDDIINHLENK